MNVGAWVGVWVGLVVFLLLMLVAGIALAIWRSYKDYTGLKPLFSKISEKVAGFSEPYVGGEEKPVSLARRVSDVAQDYQAAHTDLLNHKARVRAVHATRFSRWAAFNTAREQERGVAQPGNDARSRRVRDEAQ